MSEASPGAPAMGRASTSVFFWAWLATALAATGRHEEALHTIEQAYP